MKSQSRVALNRLHTNRDAFESVGSDKAKMKSTGPPILRRLSNGSKSESPAICTKGLELVELAPVHLNRYPLDDAGESQDLV